MTKTATTKVEKLAASEEMPLIEISTVFPFTLIPNKVLVYRNKVVIVRKYFPVGKNEFPILIADIKTVTVTTSFIFAGLFFEVTGYEQNPEPITYLRKKDALNVRKLVTGLVIIKKEDAISYGQVDEKVLVESAMELGT